MSHCPTVTISDHYWSQLLPLFISTRAHYILPCHCFSACLQPMIILPDTFVLCAFSFLLLPSYLLGHILMPQLVSSFIRPGSQSTVDTHVCSFSHPFSGLSPEDDFSIGRWVADYRPFPFRLWVKTCLRVPALRRTLRGKTFLSMCLAQKILWLSPFLSERSSGHPRAQSL